MIDLFQSATLLILGVAGIVQTRLIARQRRRIDALANGYARLAQEKADRERQAADYRRAVLANITSVDAPGQRGGAR